MNALLSSLWQYRNYIIGSVKREFELRYTRSVLGFVWTVLEPLSMIIVYTLIFSTVMKARLPGLDDSWSYAIYLCMGILFWTLFAEIVNRCQTMFISEVSLLKKTSFPRLSLPCVILLSAAVNFVIFFALVFPVFVFSKEDARFRGHSAFPPGGSINVAGDRIGVFDRYVKRLLPRCWKERWHLVDVLVLDDAYRVSD
jgi:ABC-type polysaccharide/polyol phosphate export permease